MSIPLTGVRAVTCLFCPVKQVGRTDIDIAVKMAEHVKTKHAEGSVG